MQVEIRCEEKGDDMPKFSGGDRHAEFQLSQGAVTIQVYF